MVEGAALHCEGSPARILAAFDDTMAAVGYAPTSSAADLEIGVAAAERGVCFFGPVSTTFASALARKLAARLRAPVRVLGARLVEHARPASTFECDVADTRVAPDGSTTTGPWADDLVREFGSSWGDLCDGKSYHAVPTLLANARATVLERA